MPSFSKGKIITIAVSALAAAALVAYLNKHRGDDSLGGKLGKALGY